MLAIKIVELREKEGLSQQATGKAYGNKPAGDFEDREWRVRGLHAQNLGKDRRINRDEG